FPYTWLRDSDPQLVHSATRQKLHSSSQVPLDVGELPLKAELTEDGTRVKIVWEWPNETEFSVEMLRRYSHLTLEDAFRHAIKPFPWTQKELVRSDDLTMSYDSLCISKDDDDAVVRRGIEQLLKYGILFVEGIPSEETSDERCETGKLARIFGIVRETIYGRLWDVVSRGETSRNIAYTNLDLGLHMDLAYCENPPRYQVLHMLRNTGVVGGESIFSDGYHAAYTLLEEDREAFDVLCQRPVAFQYMNEHHHLYREHRTIQLASSVVVPEVAYINYSPPFQAPLPLHTNLDSRFLPALKKFTKLLHTDDRLYERAMKPGMAVIFDNRRVLHGRREFQSQSQMEEELGVQRWLKGCYLEGDVLLDRLRVIR
ncbi:uncharacterized protein EI90DRAFT_2875318, partial [Cantharellus anzutake]|uniref:uncharacterized protein n=1 Tax=Cantharellus anzutake TaxID=1750568 RepID=UPI0019048488